MTIKRIHHINFVVENLDASIRQYEKIFGEDVFEKDGLPERGVLTARAKVGEQWFILVQPVDLSLAPGRHLREKGEGFFLMSLEVDSMGKSVRELSNKGIKFTSKSERKGLMNWWVQDLEKDDTSGEQLQLCEERK